MNAAVGAPSRAARLARRVPLSRRSARRLAVSLVVALAVAALVSLASVRGVFELQQLQATDVFFRSKPVEAASHSVLVGIDERSVAALRSHGRVFSWPRSLYAQVIENLARARARVIVFDILFSEPSQPDEDMALARAMANAKNVLQPVFGDENTGRTVVFGEPPAYTDLLQPLPELASVSLGLGHVNQFPDEDGTVRRIPLLIKVGDQEVPALPLVAATKYLRRPEVLAGPRRPDAIPIWGRDLPVDGLTRMYIHWLGPPSQSGDPASSIPQIAFVDALNGSFDPALVRGKLVFIGVTATGFADDYWVPTARTRKMQGVEIHAHAAETILGPRGQTTVQPAASGQGDQSTRTTTVGFEAPTRAQFFSPASHTTTTALIVAAALVMALAVYALSPFLAALIGVALALVYLVAAQYVFTEQGVLLNLVTPPLSLLLSFTALMANRIVFEQREQRLLRGMFAAYVPPDVVEELARDPEQVRRVGGERREITVVFSDLKGFTSISETMPPEVLARVINQFLNAMTRVIFENRGTVDKYIGDAVMAFWNAPRDVPDHAALACKTALQMQAALRALSERFQAEGLPALSMRIGINTGVAAVGNMGSDLRVAYTAMGDTVNLGARLEPLNNEYGTSICISEYTLRAAGPERFLVRFLDLVAVKGKREPVAVYELIAERPANGRWSDVLDPLAAAMLEHYERGIELYRLRDFHAAHACFAAARAVRPDDGPSQVYYERTLDLVENPPPPDWDGVYVMKHK